MECVWSCHLCDYKRLSHSSSLSLSLCLWIWISKLPWILWPQELSAPNNHECEEASASPAEPPEEPNPGQDLDYSLWHPKQGTHLSCAQTPPDSQKLWDNKCVVLCFQAMAICYTAIENQSSFQPSPSQVWLSLSFTVEYSSRGNSQVTGGGGDTHRVSSRLKSLYLIQRCWGPFEGF